MKFNIRSYQSFILIFLNNKSRIARLTGELGWIVFGQLASIVGSFVLVRVLTNYLDPFEYGRLGLVLTVSTFSSQIFLSGVPSVASRFYSIAVENNDLKGFLRSTGLFTLYATAITVLITLIAIPFLYLYGYQQWVILSILAVLFAIVSTYSSAISSIQNSARNRSNVAIHSGMEAWLKIGIGICIFKIIGASSTSVLLAFLVSSILIGLSQLFFFKRITNPFEIGGNVKRSEAWLQKMWIYSWPLMAGGLFNWAFFASQRWSLELFVSTSDVGKFFALTQVVATPITLAGGLVITLISPILFSRVGNLSASDKTIASKKIVVKLAALGMALVFLLAILSSFFSEAIFKLFVAPEYLEVAKYMPIVIISTGVLQCSQVLGIVLTIAMQTKKVLPLAILGQSLIVLFNLIFVWYLGINGLFYSMVLGSFIHLIWMILIIKNVKE